MTVVALGIDALDPDLIDTNTHSNLVLKAHRSIETIPSTTGEPSTHELWPTIITGLRPSEHGLTLEDDGVAWENPILNTGSDIADVLLPDALQTRIGAWVLTNADVDAFQTPATYYRDHGIDTLFDKHDAVVIGVPNYVIEPDTEDREHAIRRSLGDLFQRDPEATGGHISADPEEFYEQCLEMAMVRIARTRRGLRGRRHELVFGYTSGLDLVGHIAYQVPGMQERAYVELNEFVGELRSDLEPTDELVLVSDHGLQDGVHTDNAMVASTDPELIEQVDSVLDVRGAIEAELEGSNHTPTQRQSTRNSKASSDAIREQLEELGYME
jgi:hypothetical protein